MSQVRDKILDWHQGRRPELVALKLEKLAADPFSFFRGTAHLFYEIWGRERLPAASLAWLCGDAHPENIGSYQGDNGITYFDLNDFDKACLGPLHWEIGRALTSLYVAGMGAHAGTWIAHYRRTLAEGKPAHIQPEIATGPMAELLGNVSHRKAKNFIKERVKDGALRIRERHSYPLKHDEQKQAFRVYARWVQAQEMEKRAGLQPLDICGRIAGNDSLGMARYLVLVRGAVGQEILDMKESSPHEPIRGNASQKAWSCGAERVAEVQRMMQYVSSAKLSWISDGARSFTLRRLQVSEDRVELAKLNASESEAFVTAWAGLLASAHLRTASWRGSAKLDELIDFGTAQSGDFKVIAAAAKRVAKLQLAQYAEFVASS